jgi:hypothetical protein
VEQLLDRLPAMFQGTTIGDNCMSAALSAAYEVLVRQPATPPGLC